MPVNMRWTIYLKALVVKLIDSSFVKQQPNLEYFRLFVHLEDFTPHGCSLKKTTANTYLQLVTLIVEVREVILYFLLTEV